MGIEKRSDFNRRGTCGRFGGIKKSGLNGTVPAAFFMLALFVSKSRGDPCDRPFYGLSHQHRFVPFDEVSPKRTDAVGGLSPCFDRSESAL